MRLRPGFVGLALVWAACRTRPLALGEALLVIDTDVAIPKHVNRLRVDVLADDGRVLDTRDVIAARPEEWPVSFSVVADREELRSVTVRLRAYAEGHVVTRAEALRDAGPMPTFFPESIEAACLLAPTLELGRPLVMRRGARAITTVLPFAQPGDAGITCVDETRAGSAVARVEVPAKGTYRFSVVTSTPDGAVSEPGGDTTLAVRRDCALPTSQLACNDDTSGRGRLSELALELEPGAYWLVTGGADPAVADLTLLASAVDAPPVAAAPSPPVVGDQMLEPAAGATIERLVRVDLVQGYRGTVPVVLSGECFGTPSDLPGLRTCVSRAGELAPVPRGVADGALERTRPRPPLWSAEVDAPCTVPTGPDEVCVPGGAFVLGDGLSLTDLATRTRPERMRVVEPFLLDRFELTVARYRAALAGGLRPLVSDPRPNEGAIEDGGQGKACTFSLTRTDREAFPLTCVTFARAREICRSLGGDLPTEDQWELAATAAGRPVETQYPWGDELPTCERARVQRGSTGSCGGFGPVAVDDPSHAGDVSALGLRGLGGNVMEWLATGFFAYDDPVWSAAGLRLPIADGVSDGAPLRAVRGGDWAGFGLYATGSARRAQAPAGNFDNVGFRCARPGR